MKLIILWILFLSITLFTSLTRFRQIAFAGAIEVLTSLNKLNYIYSYILLLLLLVFLVRKNIRSPLRFIGFLVISILWLFSGRTVGIKPWPENYARISSDFYIFKTNEFQLCQGFEDCVSVVDNTNYKVNRLWSISFDNKYLDESIFIGPITWKGCKSISRLYFKEKEIGVKDFGKKE